MKTLLLLLFGLLIGIVADHYWQVVENITKLMHPPKVYQHPLTPAELPVMVSANVDPKSEALLQAADQAEQGDTAAFDLQIYQLGEQINASVIGSLHLSKQAKLELDKQLAVSYPEIAREVRSSYLQQIRTLKPSLKQHLTSTQYKTKAEILAGAINSSICSFSNLVLIPMRLNIGIAGNIAAGYAFSDPCQRLLSGVSTKVGNQIYRAGMIKDLELLQTNLVAEKRSAIAQLSTSEIQINVRATQTIKRSIGTLTHWEAARLSVDYSALVQFGYDLTEGFTIRRDDINRTIQIDLPAVKLLQVTMEPVNTNATDGGIIDLTNDNFRAVYQKARADAIQLAEQQGGKNVAADEIRSLLTCIYQPFTSIGKTHTN